MTNMRAPVTIADVAAAETLMVMLYGGESNARAQGALGPLPDTIVVAATPPEEAKTAVSGKQPKKVGPVALEVAAVVAGPARMSQLGKRQRVQRRRWSSSSEEEETVEGDVPIGTGQTRIPQQKYKKCRWQNYRFATRSLLDAVFTKKVLATHCVTGKSSPAFAHLPAKKRLNPTVVADITMEITAKYKVPQSAVRAVITTKCADEAKISKNMRLKKEAGAQRKKRGRRQGHSHKETEI